MIQSVSVQIPQSHCTGQLTEAATASQSQNRPFFDPKSVVAEAAYWYSVDCNCRIRVHKEEEALSRLLMPWSRRNWNRRRDVDRGVAFWIRSKPSLA